MKLNEFIEKYEALDKDIDIKFNKYVNIREKCVAANDIATLLSIEFNNNFYTLEYEISKNIKELYYLIKLYTDIDIDIIEFGEDYYDTVKRLGIDRYIMRNINIRDYDLFIKIVNDMIDLNDIRIIKSSITSVDYDVASDAKKFFSEIKDNKDVIEKISGIVKYNGGVKK